MSIDYKQLESMVREAMFTGGGINGPAYPENIPARMPAADTDEKEQDMGDEDANKMYDMAVKARGAVEELIVALDEPIYDDAYEQAFKASASLRKALNSLVGSGAHPMPDQRVAAPDKLEQPYGSGGGMDYYGMGYANFGDGIGLQEALEDLSPKVKEAAEMISGLDEAERKELHAFITGTATK